MNTKNFAFDIKEVGEDGIFTGLLSVYGNVDRGGDVVEPGALKKSIEANNGTLTMLWQHDRKEPIGLMELHDTPAGLQVKGIFDLDVQRGREAYSLVKKRIVKGLSIGYNTVKDAVQGGIRHLEELELMEGSVVTFPMNPLAVIQTVKDVPALIAIVKDDDIVDAKAGRRHSAATRQQIMDAMGIHDEIMAMHGRAKGILQSMLDAEQAESPDLDLAALAAADTQFKTELVHAITAQ